jgi:predicted Na+-dependent transporter
MSLKDYRLSVVVFLGLLLGFILPQVGLLLKPYLSYILMLIMFITCLKINPEEFRKIRFKTIVAAMALSLVVVPLFSLGGLIFTPLVFTGFLLALSCPSAASSAFFTDSFGGNASLALVITTIANLISIVSLPVTMLIGVGTSVSFDATVIVMNMIQIILIPLIAAFIARRYMKNLSNAVTRQGSSVSSALILLVLWGGMASGVGYIESNIPDFLGINLIFTVMIALSFAASYFLSMRFGRKDAIALGVTSFMKNAILALVIGSVTFSPGVLPALVANLIDQNIILILLGIFFKRK